MKKKLLVALLAASMLGTMMGSTITSMASDAEGDAVTLDLYIDFTWYPTDSWSGIIPEELTKNGGVYFDVTRSADDSQLGLMIASGELPDVIFTSNEIDRLCDSDLCWSYDELIEMYDIDWEAPSDKVAIAKSHNAKSDDEHFYTILQNYSTNEEWAEAEDVLPNLGCGYYRKDIWEALGSPSMDTIEDVINVLKMVKENYPDMIPLSGGGPTWRFSPMALWYGVNEDYIYDENGDPVYRDTTTNFYEYLKLVNELYREGLFPEENLAITNEDDAKQQALNGQCFMYEWCARPSNIDQLNTATQANIPEAEWAPLVFVEDNEPVIRENAGWAGVFISKNCKDPEAAIKMIAYMNSEEGQHLALWGREGIDYTIGENGLPQFSDEWKEAMKDESQMTSVYNNNFYMCTTELTELNTYYSGVDQDLLDSFMKNKVDFVNHPELSVAKPTSTSDMGIIKAKIDEARDAELVKIYTAGSDEEFEAAYADYMALLDKIGVQELNAYMKETVANVIEQYGF
jgi:putative aldouronate transport system substrate-binding protein